MSRHRRHSSAFAAALSLAAPIVASASLLATTRCSSLGESRVVGPFTLALTPKSAPALSAGQTKLFESQRSIALPLVERPTLSDAAKVAPYARALWFSADDLRAQLSYVITNTGDKDVTVELTVDLWNEFVRYVPAVHISEEQTSIDPSPVDRLIIVPAKGRAVGTVAYDDFEQAAYMLATLMNKPDEPYHVLDPHTHLATDPLTQGFVPTQIAGVTGFDLGIRTREEASIALEATVELVDQGQHLTKQGDASKNGPPGEKYTPPPAR
jgi:hypothetical protein